MQTLPTWVEVDLDRLVENIDALRRVAGKDVGILLTVKADAYGHGAVQVAQAARGRVDRFGVATLDEALELSLSGVDAGILILSPILQEEIPTVVENGFAVTVSSLAFARRVSEVSVASNKTTEVHIEVDTGMGRAGVWPAEFETLAREVSLLPGVRLGGLLTHFPASDTDPGGTRQQLDEFVELLARVRAAGTEVPLAHCANSAAVVAMPETHLQMIRPGLVAYGLLPAGTPVESPTTPILSWKSRIVQVRSVPKGRSISYGRTHTTQRDIQMGVVPVGYGHGYPWRLSGTGQMLAGGRRVPVLGRVTMDMTMVDLTDVDPTPSVGDEIVLIGRQGQECVTADDLADWAGTINYEIVCGIGKRVPRVYLRHGKVQTYKSLLGTHPDPVLR